VPLFTSYVFVRITEAEKPKVRETPGVVNFVMHEGKPAVVREKEIERIQRFLDEYDDVEAIHHIEKNQRVTVQKGLFVEKEGRVIDFQNSKVKVVIDSLGYTLVALFDKSKLTSK
jgi:transcription antitermination factor NusG